jgi:hypothetical protein
VANNEAAIDGRQSTADGRGALGPLAVRLLAASDDLGVISCRLASASSNVDGAS